MRKSKPWLHGLGLLIVGAAGLTLACERDAGADQTSGGQLVANISQIVNHGSNDLIKFQIPYQAAVGQGEQLWDGFGPLPGAFQAPWRFETRGFDPTFHISYWAPGKGMVDFPDASLGMVPNLPISSGGLVGLAR